MPTAGPFIAAITGLGMVRRRVSIGMYSLRRTLPTSSGVRIPPSPPLSLTSPPAPAPPCRPHPAVAAHLPHVRARAERATRPRQHDNSHRFVALRLLDRVAELPARERADRVHL